MTHPESLNFDQVADRYEATRGGETRGKTIAPDLARLLRAHRPVLELGVGSAIVAKALATLGLRVLGIDISEHMLARARERIGDRVVLGDAMALPFATGAVDQMVAAWMLHTVADVPTVMREIARVLNVSGVCLIVDAKPMVDENDPVAIALREIQAELGIEPRLSAQNYAALARDAGLVVTDIVTSGPHQYETCIADAARDIETRFSSWMWDVPDEDWHRAVSPVLERLRTAPDFERRTWRDGYQEILVLNG